LIEIEPFTLRQARKSALVVAAVFALLGGWQLYRARPTVAITFGVLAAILVLCSAIPPAAMVFHRAWMTLAGVLGYVNSRILLAIIFYLILSPLGVIKRVFGSDLLDRRSGKAPSYWRQRTATRQTREGFERAF
jgi:hypothetical protein